MSVTSQFPSETSPAGAFVRQQYSIRDRITADGSSGFPAEPDRYHLYVSLACPWAQRAIIVRRLLGLEPIVSMSVVDPIRDAETVETELMLADLDSLERRVVAAQKRARGGDRETRAQLDIMEPALAALRDGKPARLAAIPTDRRRELQALQLLTAKLMASRRPA